MLLSRGAAVTLRIDKKDGCYSVLPKLVKRGGPATFERIALGPASSSGSTARSPSDIKRASIPSYPGVRWAREKVVGADTFQRLDGEGHLRTFAKPLILCEDDSGLDKVKLLARLILIAEGKTRKAPGYFVNRINLPDSGLGKITPDEWLSDWWERADPECRINIFRQRETKYPLSGDGREALAKTIADLESPFRDFEGLLH